MSAINKLEKVYLVEFIEYTNYARDDVSHNTKPLHINVGKEGFLVRESDLNLYQDFGKGYRSVTLVGQLPIIDEEKLGVK